MNFPQLAKSRALIPLLLLAITAPAATARAEEQFSARYSVSADNRLENAGASAGAIGVRAAFANWRSSFALSETTKLSYGASWHRYDFSGPLAIGVPERLQEISVALGASHRRSPRWLLSASIQPGLYGDLEGSTHDAFNAPALALATFLQSRELAWSFGLRADAFADNPVLPILGVNWRFQPDWEFTIGYPRAGFVHTVNPALKLALGVTVQGGSFQVAGDPIMVVGGSPLEDTALDYREIRVGLSLEYELHASFTLTFEAGTIADQKFDYYERDLTLNGGAAGFFTVGLSGRF